MIQKEIPEVLRSVLFGFFLGAFPLAQFFFAPILGEYADRRGRRNVFIFTVLIEALGYAISAFGIQYNHLTLLFVGRFLTGLAAGNMSLCLATLVDLSSDEKTKLRYFSVGYALAGAMFVLGPFLGGKLSDPTIYKYFSFAFPMWVGAALALLNLIVLFFLFREEPERKTRKHLDLISSVHNVKKAFGPHTHDLYVIYFFFLLAWNLLYQFLPALLVEKFRASSNTIGNLSALMGIIWIVGTLFITSLRHTHISRRALILFSLCLFALATFLLPFPKKISLFVIAAGIAVFCVGGMWPLFTGAISNSTHPEMQGKVLGVSQSIQSLSMALAPFLGGFFLQAHNKIPFMVATFSALVALFLLLVNSKKLF